MPLIRSLRLASWLLCGVYATIPGYWLAVHPFTKCWRRMHYKWQLLLSLWFLMCVLAWSVSYPWRLAAIHPGPEGWAVAPFLGLFSLILYTQAARGLTLRRVIGGDELQRARHSDVLVTDGVHGMVRHPMYLGHLSTMFLLTVGAATEACVGLFCFALLTGGVMIFFEERELHERFGAEWERYCARTPVIIPQVKP